MIHQLIFAHPRPGMSEKDFQDYWVNIHAVNYASKIPQIRRYLIDLRIPFGAEPVDPLFSGVAEIWLENEAEQIASLQSKEFIEGARRDEPNWAAFWRTVGLDTTAHVLMEGEPLQRDSKRIKLLIMVKRKAGMPLAEFRQTMLHGHAAKVMKIPGLQRYLQCHVRDSFYAIGESILDCVSQLWFDDLSSLEKALNSPEYENLILPEFGHLFETNYVHSMVTAENWIIGPDFR
ncbi:ethyl tert-butyl ether degradation protein EthD [Chroococcidiopsis sp. CCALA 051]|uniref:EthD domain-containing protein n=1 Tax=Chroococcidiopsis sp. CCALA 051 TaxID=869949 RepID=UPI000D0CC986|nr:EthD domain-containing protein [Chroococcidiopsis sp. CCALA 051]MBE9015620.1 EthD domain-containing protein [Chroococcidiopsidales cyanobacterium LEGE 13417]PSM47247.1 ethyl tert-butyl ether degradation protein EthD [Chroococcidiopsis sp. CCALA 051]